MRWKYKLKTTIANLRRYLQQKVLGFFRKNPPLSPSILLWSRKLGWGDFFIHYSANPFSLDKVLQTLFALCYLRGFFAFEEEISNYYGLGQEVVMFFILLFVFLLNIRSSNSLVNLPLTFVYWTLLLLLIEPGNSTEFDLVMCFRILVLISAVRPTLLLLIYVCAFAILRNPTVAIKIEPKLFYLSPDFANKKYSSENIPGKKSISKAFLNYFCFLLWCLLLLASWFSFKVFSYPS